MARKQRLRVVHVVGSGDVVAFPGVLVRRMLSDRWTLEPNEHPPRGQFGKAALSKKQKPKKQNLLHQDVGLLVRPEHKNIPWEALKPHQRDAYEIRNEGEALGILTDWELEFLWSIAGHGTTLTEKQVGLLKKLASHARMPLIRTQ